MSANPPALTVRRNFPRPEPAIVDAFRETATGAIADANGRRGAPSWQVRPLARAVRFCGVALTVRTRPRDNLAPYAALGYARKGDVLVVAANAYEEASVAGDVLLGMARNAGIVALVTDVAAREAKMDAGVRDGVSVPPRMEETLAKAGVRYLD